MRSLVQLKFNSKTKAARFVLLLFFLTSVSFHNKSLAQATHKTSSSASFSRTSRVDELFIWKISEELKLSVKEEKEISTLIMDLNLRKTSANEKIDGIIKNMASAELTASSQKSLKEYKTALAEYNKISLDEIACVEKALPKVKAAKYFVVKADLSKRIRTLLSAPDRNHERQWERPERTKVEKIPFGEPKIIEE